MLPTTVYGVACLAPELLLCFEPVRNNWDLHLWPALRRWCVHPPAASSTEAAAGEPRRLTGARHGGLRMPRQTYAELMGDRAALVVAQSVPVVAALVMKLATGCKQVCCLYGLHRPLTRLPPTGVDWVCGRANTPLWGRVSLPEGRVALWVRRGTARPPAAATQLQPLSFL